LPQGGNPLKYDAIFPLGDDWPEKCKGDCHRTASPAERAPIVGPAFNGIVVAKA
jgi:hypothetical protein